MKFMLLLANCIFEVYVFDLIHSRICTSLIFRSDRGRCYILWETSPTITIVCYAVLSWSIGLFFSFLIFICSIICAICGWEMIIGSDSLWNTSNNFIWFALQATKLYCFVHKVPVCGQCICFPEHQICVVQFTIIRITNLTHSSLDLLK